MPLPYKACLFDLDGTLVDTLHSIAYFGNNALSAFALPPIPVQTYKQLVGNGADVLIHRMLKTVNADLPPEKEKALRAEYDRLYESDPLALAGPYPGLPDVLEKLHAQGLRLGVLSNKPDNMAQYVAQAFYGPLLDTIRGQRPQTPKKPDPAAALEICAAWGLLPRDVLYIGDSGVDMQTGQNAGMDTCGVLWGFRTEEELRTHGAKYVAGDPSQLEAAATGKGRKP